MGGLRDSTSAFLSEVCADHKKEPRPSGSAGRQRAARLASERRSLLSRSQSARLPQKTAARESSPAAACIDKQTSRPHPLEALTGIWTHEEQPGARVEVIKDETI